MYSVIERPYLESGDLLRSSPLGRNKVIPLLTVLIYSIYICITASHVSALCHLPKSRRSDVTCVQLVGNTAQERQSGEGVSVSVRADCCVVVPVTKQRPLHSPQQLHWLRQSKHRGPNHCKNTVLHSPHKDNSGKCITCVCLEMTFMWTWKPLYLWAVLDIT